MAEKAEKLHALLCGEGRELINLKFFPGLKAKTSEDLLNGAYDMLSHALKGEETGVIPTTVKESKHFTELVNAK